MRSLLLPALLVVLTPAFADAAVCTYFDNATGASVFTIDFDGPPGGVNSFTFLPSGTVFNPAASTITNDQPLQMAINDGTSANALTISAGNVVQSTGIFASLAGLSVTKLPEPSTASGILLLSFMGIGFRRKRRAVA